MSYFVYILKSRDVDRYYIGHSADYVKRLAEHNRRKVKSTKAFVPWNIIYLERLESKSAAFNREMQIKSYKSGEAFKHLIDSAHGEMGEWLPSPPARSRRRRENQRTLNELLCLYIEKPGC